MPHAATTDRSRWGICRIILAMLLSAGFTAPSEVRAQSIDAFITDQMTVQHFPGLAACIVKGGRILWQGSYGYANLTRQSPVTPETPFMMASISKTATATALMQIWENLGYDLDDTVNAYLPFIVKNPYFPGTPITFRMLLTHTSSIKDNWNVMNALYTWDEGSMMSLGDFVREYFTPGGLYYNASLNFYSYAPGGRWNYSNIGISLCGYLVEVLSGISFGTYCRDSVFAPLGMVNTSWYMRDLDTALAAHAYTYSAGTYKDLGLYTYPDLADGALRTSLSDLTRFMVAHMGGGRIGDTRILETPTVQLMRTVQYPALNPNMGLVWFRQTIDERLCWGHGGSDAGVRTLMFFCEADSVGVITLANGGGTLWPIMGALFAAADTIGLTGIASTSVELAHDFTLEQNYPNPFNASTLIRFRLPERADVRLEVINLIGQVVGTVLAGELSPGYHEVPFDAGRLPSGSYLCRLISAGHLRTQKMTLLR